MATMRAGTWLGLRAKPSMTQEIAATLARQAEMAGEHLQSLATAFRDVLPTNGAAALVSEGVESARAYLGERDVREIGTDAVDLVRRHPVQAMLFGAGLGWLFVRWTSRRRWNSPIRRASRSRHGRRAARRATGGRAVRSRTKACRSTASGTFSVSRKP